MKSLILLFLSSLLIACSPSMSPREMISDCFAEVAPISYVKVAGDQYLKDECYNKFRSCLVACYLEVDCSKAHEDAINACECFKQGLAK